MKRDIISRTLLLIGVLIACGMVLAATGCTGISGAMTGYKNQLKVGLSQVDITPRPDVGVAMRGYRRYGKSIGTHDPLYARCLALESPDGTKAIMLVASVVGCSHDTMLKIRQAIGAQTGVPVEHIMVSVTHTHSGPVVEGTPYEAQFIKDCTATGIQAWQTRFPGRIGIDNVDLPTIAGNDRRMEYGGRMSDPVGSVIKVEDAWGRLRGVAFCYGLHPTTLDMFNLLFSEDWCGYALAGIREKLGGDVWVAYFQSAEGDSKGGHTAEVSAVGASMTDRFYDWAQIRGKLFVDPITAAVAKVKTDPNPVIKVADAYLEYPRRTAYPITVAEAQKIYDDCVARLKAVEAELAKQPPMPTDKEELERQLPLPPDWQYRIDPSRIGNTRIGMRLMDQVRIDIFLAGLSLSTAKRISAPDWKPTVKMEQMVIRVGDTAIASLPGEVFTDLSRDIKAGSPFKKTMTVGLALDSGGYLPPKSEFLEGHYAVLGSSWSPATGEVFVKKTIELINRVK